MSFSLMIVMNKYSSINISEKSVYLAIMTKPNDLFISLALPNILLSFYDHYRNTGQNHSLFE